MGKSLSTQERLRPVFSTLGYLVSWIVLGIIATLTIFQIHSIVLAVALNLIENPATRPLGWSTDSLYGLSRIAWLFLGVPLLLWIIFTEEYLREGNRFQILKQRVIRLFLIIGAIYIICYGILLFVV